MNNETNTTTAKVSHTQTMEIELDEDLVQALAEEAVKRNITLGQLLEAAAAQLLAAQN